MLLSKDFKSFDRFVKKNFILEPKTIFKIICFCRTFVAQNKNKHGIDGMP